MHLADARIRVEQQPLNNERKQKITECFHLIKKWRDTKPNVSK